MKLTIQKPFHTTSYSITTNSRHMYEWLEIAYGEYATNVAQATHNIHNRKNCVSFLDPLAKETTQSGGFFFGCSLWRVGLNLTPPLRVTRSRGLGARPPPVADEGSATREKTRRFGSERRRANRNDYVFEWAFQIPPPQPYCAS